MELTNDATPITPGMPEAQLDGEEEHRFRQEYLYAFAPQVEVTNYVRTQALDMDENRQAQVLADWALLQQTVQQVGLAEAGLPDTIAIEPVDPALAARAAEYLADPIFTRQFNLPFEVAVVEVDKLVAFQRQVNSDHVGRMMAKFGPNPTAEDLLDICVSPRREMEPVLHLEHNQQSHSFSSPNSDIRFLGSFLHQLSDDDVAHAEHGGVPTAAIIAFIGYGAPMVNALAIGGRVILNNGFHRVVALRRLGVERIPLVLQRVTNPQLELPEALGGLPRDYFTNNPRPPMVKDFFAPGFTLSLEVRERVKLVNLVVQVGDQEVPV